MWQEALVLQRQLAETFTLGSNRYKELENAEDRATSEEPEWFKDFDDEQIANLAMEERMA